LLLWSLFEAGPVRARFGIHSFVVAVVVLFVAVAVVLVVVVVVFVLDLVLVGVVVVRTIQAINANLLCERLGGDG